MRLLSRALLSSTGLAAPAPALLSARVTAACSPRSVDRLAAPSSRRHLTLARLLPSLRAHRQLLPHKWAVRSEISAIKTGRIKATFFTPAGEPVGRYPDWSTLVDVSEPWTDERVRAFFEESGADRAEEVIAAANQELSAIQTRYDECVSAPRTSC